MKKLIFLSLALLFLSFIPVIESEKLIGTWEYIAQSPDDGSGSFTFTADGYCTMHIDGETLGGKKFYIEDDDIWVQLTYETNYSQTPYKLDLVLTELSSKTEFQRMPCIFNFLNSGDLQIAMGDDGIRPTEFNEDNSATLKKVK